MQAKEIQLALAGDPECRRTLVHTLLPVVQAEVGFGLQPLERVQPAQLRGMVHGICQEVFVELLGRGERSLGRWPVGSCLEQFVRDVARSHVEVVVRRRWSSAATRRVI